MFTSTPHALDIGTVDCEGVLGEGAVRKAWHRIVRGGLLQVWLGTLLSTLLGLDILGHIDRANLLWPVSGVALALVLPLWHMGWSKRLRLLAAGAAGFWTAATLLGMPWRPAVLLSVLTCMDLVLGGWALSPKIKAFDDLKDESNILRFLLVAVLAPAITGSLGAYPVAKFLQQPVASTLLMSIFGNSLGMAISLPAALLLLSRDPLGLRKLGQDRVRASAAAVLFLGVAVFVFWQTANPLLFMVFPSMVLLILTMGLEGSVLASVALSIIGWVGTSHGHGPILLAKGTPLHQLLVFQAYIWISLAVALPVGALLDERRRAEHDVKESQSIYRVLLQNADDLIVLSSLDGTNRYVSPAVTRLAGWTQEEYLALDRLKSVHPDDRETAEQMIRSLGDGVREQTLRYRMCEKSGGWKWVEAIVRAYGVEGEAISGYVGTVRDISGLIQTEASWQKERRVLVKESRELATLASTDPLTGVLNRRGFEERVDLLKQSSRFPVSILLVDLDFFKHYNDTYGHLAGDECLVKVATILQAHATRSDDIVARMGGEEFAVVLAGTSLEEAMLLAEAMCSDLRCAGLQHRSSPFGVATMSVGVATQEGSGELEIVELIANADSSLYLSKRTRDRVTAYSKPVELVGA